MSAILHRHIIKRKFKLSTMKIIAIFLLFLLIQKSIGFDEIDSNAWRWRDHRRRCHGRLNLYKDSENHMRYVAIFWNFLNIIFMDIFYRYYETQDLLHPYPKGIVKAKATGTCCWKIYQRSGFFGYNQVIRPGSKMQHVKIKNVKSFKKYDCH